jgi:protein-tyrosine phosphatase
LRRHGYDGSAHRARQFDPAWYGDRDLILAMDSGHLSALTRRAGEVPIELFAEADVPDPYFHDAEFDDVLAQIEKAADQWVDRLRTN